MSHFNAGRVTNVFDIYCQGKFGVDLIAGRVPVLCGFVAPYITAYPSTKSLVKVK